MRYYPIFVDLRGRRCVVVGGGRVAERKARALLRAGADVHVVSPAVTPRLALLAARKRLSVTPRAYKKGDLSGPASGQAPLLVFAATDNPETQQAVRHDAEAAGALVNTADERRNSSFLVPASFLQGDLHVAISTSGASPALARRLRRQLQVTLGREYRGYVQFLRQAREQILDTIPNQQERAWALRQLTFGLVDLDPIVGTRKAGAQLTKLLRKLGAKVGVTRKAQIKQQKGNFSEGD